MHCLHCSTIHHLAGSSSRVSCMCKCEAVGSASFRTACPVCSTIHQVSGSGCGNVSLLPRLSISTSPTGLDECFFFNSLVVRLPCGSIFCQFWLFLFLNCCCSSFGCVRSYSVSTYASILVFFSSPLSFLIVFIWNLSLFFLMSLLKGLSILFIFSKNQLLDSLILKIVLLVSISFDSALILVVFSFHVLWDVFVVVPRFLVGVGLGCLFEMFLSF